MPRTRRSLLRALAGGSASVTTAGLAGCLGAGGGNATPTDSATPSPTAESTPMSTPTETTAEGATVTLSTIDPWGQVLTDAEGVSLYLFTKDTDGTSVCTGDCAESWPPLTVEGEPSKGSGVTGSLGTTERDDGNTQVTLNGWPLYYFAPDSAAGDVKGQGIGDVWWLVDAAGEPVYPTVWTRTHPDLGDVLMGADGLTLYMFDKDTRGAGASACSGGCAESWPPLTVAGEPTVADDVEAEITTFEREDGSMQVAANGWPLYYFASDSKPSHAKGQAVADVWWVLGPDGSPKRASGSSKPASRSPTPTPTDSVY